MFLFLKHVKLELSSGSDAFLLPNKMRVNEMRHKKTQSRDTSGCGPEMGKKWKSEGRQSQGPAGLRGAGNATRGFRPRGSRATSAKSWKRNQTEQNSRLTAVLCELSAKDKKPKKGHLLVMGHPYGQSPSVTPQMPWSSRAWTGKGKPRTQLVRDKTKAGRKAKPKPHRQDGQAEQNPHS